MKRTHAILILLFLFAASHLNAQTKEEEKYAALVQEIRNEIWSMNLPDFKNTTVPEKYKNEPAVVLAAYEQLELIRKTKFDWSGAALTKQQITYRSIYRQMVYINSQSALESMSEYSFQSRRKERYTGDEEQRVLGIRILKPDGTVKEIDPSEYVKDNEDGKSYRKNLQESYKKLAVPGLEVGDIIDIFFAEYSVINNRNPDPMSFYFMEKYPMLAYSIHCEIDSKLSTFYRCLNGAPDFTQRIDSTGNYILDLRVGDLGRTLPVSWYNSARQTPMILMYIYNIKTPYPWTPPSAKKQGMQANPNAQAMISDTRAFMKSPIKIWSGLLSGRKNEISKALKAKQAEGWSDEKLMDYLYQYCFLRYTQMGADYSPEKFILLVHNLMEKAGIPHQVGITTQRKQEPLSQLINYANTIWFIYLEANGKCYAPPSYYNYPSEVPVYLQGEEAILEDNTRITLPVSTADDNRNLTTITASIDDNTLNLSRHEEIYGSLKRKIQPYLVLDEDLGNSLRRQLGITATVYDETKEKYRTNQQERYRQEREKEKEGYRNEVIAYHGSDEGLGANIGYKLLSIGNRADSIAFAYQTDYTLDGYVKKAGQNLLLSAGLLIGSQTEIKGEERRRSEDIYQEMPKTYLWDIKVRLPQDYQIASDGLEKMNTRTENECGAFIARATVENNMLHLQVEKRTNHMSEPVSNWQKILDIFDAAKAYETLTIALKK